MSRRTPSHLFALLVVTLGGWLSTAAYAASQLSVYNAIISNSLSTPSDIQGRSVVKSVVGTGSFSIGHLVSGTSTTTMAVQTSVAAGAGQINVVNGSFWIPSVAALNGRTITFPGGGALQTAPPFDFTSVFNSITAESATYAALPTNSSVTIPTSPAVTYLTVGSGVANGTPAVFSIDGNTLFHNNNVQTIDLNLNGKTPSAIIINITGTTVNYDWSGENINMLRDIGWRPKILWNFPSATTVNLDRPLYGSILAPFATLTAIGGANEGSIMVKDYQGTIAVKLPLWEAGATVCTEASDFGDSSLLASASSTASTQIKLGTNGGDIDSPATTNSTATADDLAGTDDEDGLTLPGSLTQGQTSATILANVTNTSGSAVYLNAWIDFNRNGVLTDSGEQIATNTTIVNGTSNSSRTMTFNVPATAFVGSVPMRVRLTSVGSPGPDGYDGNGEVEDHMVSISAGGTLAVGNLVWTDANDNGRFDISEGVAGVRVELYNTSNVLQTFVTTDAAGLYQLPVATAGTYYVKIPASEFAAAKPLNGRFSLIGNGTDNGRDDDYDENGIDDSAPATNGIRSANFVIAAGAEPANTGTETGADSSWDNGTAGRPTDNNGDLTVDFGFATCAQTNLITNGGFETANPVGLAFTGRFPNTATDPVIGVDSGGYATDVLNWIRQDGYYLNDATHAFEGNRCIYLSGNACAWQNFALGQSVPGLVTLNPGQAYTLSLDWAAFDQATPVTPTAGQTRRVRIEMKFYDEATNAEIVDLYNSDTFDPRANTITAAMPTTAWNALNWRRARFQFIAPPAVAGRPVLRMLITGIDGTYTPNSILLDNVTLTPACNLNTCTVGNLVYYDLNGNGRMEPGDAGVDHVRVQLISEPSGTEVAFTHTHDGGRYFFPGVQPGTYRIDISSSNFSATASWWKPSGGAASLYGLTSAVGNANPAVAAASALDDNASSLADKGIDSATPSSTGISSPSFTVALGNQPTTGGVGTENGAFKDLDIAADSNGNMAIDFAFKSSSTVDYGDWSGGTTPANAATATTSSIATANIRLGLSVDSEASVTGTASASADDIGGVDDEDGVLMPGAIIAGSTVTIPVSVFNNNTTGKRLQAWIDFNNDGTFNNTDFPAGERIYNQDTPASASQQTINISFTAPTPATFGPDRGARFRLTDSAATTPTSSGANGEIEDYAFTMAAAGCYQMNQIAGTTVTACTGCFTDSGGSAANYANDESYTATFQSPNAADKMVATFTAFATEATFDYLYVYDGPSISSPLIGSYSGNTLPGTAGVITGTGNALTFRYVSDGSNVAAGWNANLSCITGGSLAVGNLVYIDANENGRFDSGEGAPNVLVQAKKVSDNSVAGSALTVNGLFQITGLAADSYYLFIPASEFAVGKALNGKFSIVGNGGDNGRDDDFDENGIDNATPATNGIRSNNFTLADNSEPTTSETGQDGNWDNDTGGKPANDDADLTIDFGFSACYRTNLVSNGSFENASTTAPMWTGSDTFVDPNNSTDRRSFTSNVNIDRWGYDYGAWVQSSTRATDGNRFLYMNGGACAWQDFSIDAQTAWLPSLASGKYYTITFDWAAFDPANPNSPPATPTSIPVVEIETGDQTTGALWTSTGRFVAEYHDMLDLATGVTSTVSYPASPWSNLNWRRKSVQFYLPSPSSVEKSVQLVLSAGNTGILLDNVRIFESCNPSLLMAGNLIFRDNNGNGRYDAGEGVDSLDVKLFRSTQLVTDYPAAEAVTQNDGRYLFSGLQPGSYFIYIPGYEFGAGAPLDGLVSIGGTTADDALDDNASNGDNGVDNATPATNGIRSNTFTLATGAAPTGEAGFANTMDDGFDANGNLTIDLGFAAPAAAGDFGDWNGSGAATAMTSTSVNTNLRIGATVDSEASVTPNATATADGADEDGVWFAPSVTVGSYAQLSVKATNLTAAAAYLNAWVDFNANGSFDAGEQVAANVSVPVGSAGYDPAGYNSGNTLYQYYRLQFAVPATASVGTQRGVRVRLSNQLNATATGAGGTGEIEDYTMDFTAAAPCYHFKLADANNDVVFNPATEITPAQTNAPIYWDANADMGSYRDLDVTYNSSTKMFDFDCTVLQKNTAGIRTDGIWFMINTGPLPLPTPVQRYAMVYIDGFNRAAPKATVYVENSLQHGNSWSFPAHLLVSTAPGGANASDVKLLSVTEDTVAKTVRFRLSLDCTRINDRAYWPAAYSLDADWRGIQFLGNAGIWCTATDMTAAPTYDAAGKATAMNMAANSYIGIDVHPMGFQPLLTEVCPSNSDYGDWNGSGALTTTTSSNINANLRLGATVDSEASVTPDANATADGADEDGVNPLPVMTQGGWGWLNTTVTNNTGAAANLNAWIDFNNDGDFADLGEQIVTNVSIADATTNGAKFVPFQVPAAAITGTNLGMRVRLTSTSSPGPTGASGTGEVEDYVVTVIAPSTAVPGEWLVTDHGPFSTTTGGSPRVWRLPAAGGASATTTPPAGMTTWSTATPEPMGIAYLGGKYYVGDFSQQDFTTTRPGITEVNPDGTPTGKYWTLGSSSATVPKVWDIIASGSYIYAALFNSDTGQAGIYRIDPTASAAGNNFITTPWSPLRPQGNWRGPNGLAIGTGSQAGNILASVESSATQNSVYAVPLATGTVPGSAMFVETAGAGGPGYSGIRDLDTDSSGNIYVSQAATGTLRKYTAAGVLSDANWMSIGMVNGYNPTGSVWGVDGNQYIVAYDSGDIWRHGNSTGGQTQWLNWLGGDANPEMFKPKFLVQVPTVFPSIGDRIFVDVDGNNQQSAPDTGVANAYVRLYSSTDAVRDATDTLIGQAITDSTGAYTFGGAGGENMLVTGAGTTITAGPGVEADDAEEGLVAGQSSLGHVSLTSSDLDLGEDTTISQMIGVRFPALAIPAGATIVSATIQFSADATESGNVTFGIVGENADTAAAFGSADFALTSRAKTSSTVYWSPAAWTSGNRTAAQLTPNLAPIIQSIVNRAGWSSGNAIALYLQRVAGTGNRTAKTFAATSTGWPSLSITYTTGTKATIQASKQYYVTISSTDPALNGCSLITPWITGALPGDPHTATGDNLIDSNGVLNGSTSEYIASVVTPASPGANPSYDIGFVNAGADFGDFSLFSTYATASSTVNQTLKLGAFVDGEHAAVTNTTATGDDTSGIDDEDGVSLWPAMVVGTTATIPVTVTNTFGTAYLNLWIDFNNNGTIDAGETATQVNANSSGTYNISIAIPAGATTGTGIGARLRLSSVSAPAATGLVGTGEIEDHLVVINTAIGCANPYVWLVDEDASRLRLWSMDYTTPAASAINYGRMKYYDPADGVTVRDFPSDGTGPNDMEAMAINSATGQAYFMSRDKVSGGPSNSQSLWTYNLNNAAANAGNIVLSLLGHVTKVSSHGNEAMCYDPTTNRLYFSDARKDGVNADNADTIADGLVYVDLGALNSNKLLATAPTIVGTMTGTVASVSYSVRYTDGMEITPDGRIFVVDGNGDDLYELNKSTGAIIAVQDLNVIGGVAGSVDIETIFWDPLTSKLIAVDNAGNSSAHRFIHLTLGTDGANTQIAQFYPHPKMSDVPDFEGSAFWSTCPNVGIGNLVFIDANNNGKYDTGEGVNGVTVKLFPNGTATSGTPTATTTTATVNGVAGSYNFTNLTSGSYYVHIPATNFASGQPLFSCRSMVSNEGDGPNDDDIAGENGIDDAAPQTNGISSAVIALSNDGEAMDTGTEKGVLASSDNADDNNTNLTVDLGFIISTIDFGDWNGSGALTSTTGSTVNTNLRLGATIDAEPAATANATATGDDITDTDDEDGVTVPAAATLGLSSSLGSTITNTLGAPAYLNAWIDFNQNGSFADAGEQIATNIAVANGTSSGSFTMPFTVPTTATPGSAGVRVRLTTVSSPGPDGLDGTGEVEDYVITLNAPTTDFGDYAPFPSASSIVLSTIKIGSNNDAEAAATTTPDATGDDTTGSDDEDGVTVPATLIQGASSSITVVVTNTSGTTNYLNAWVDYNRNGVLTDAGEQIASNTIITNGTNGSSRVISFVTPAAATTGSTAIRVRLTSVASPGSDGADGNGEVEDHAVTIVAPAIPTDFGDWNGSLADTTTTTSQSNSNLRLGALVDAETSVTPNATASTDDVTSADDEDGVTVPTTIATGNTVTLPVSVFNNSGSNAYLNAWIDFNNDGAFSDALVSAGGERLEAARTITTSATASTQNITFAVPITATIGTQRGVRFRLTNQAVTAPTGAVGTGEIEDYVVNIAACPVILGMNLPDGVYNTAYVKPTAFSVTDGTAPFTWTVTGLPTGMALNATTTTLTGAPTQVGQFRLNVTVSDAAGCVVSKIFALRVTGCGASQWVYTWDKGLDALAGDDSGGVWKRLVMVQNQAAGTLDVSAVTDTQANNTQAMWFSITNGPTPDTALADYAAMYLTGGTVYVTPYSNAPTTTHSLPASITTTTYTNVLSGTQRTFSFQLNTNTINNWAGGGATWKGVGFPLDAQGNIWGSSATPYRMGAWARSFADGSATYVAGVWTVTWGSVGDLNIGTWDGGVDFAIPCCGLTINPTSLPGGQVGVSYVQPLPFRATGGMPPYTIGVTSGLPPGLTLNTSTMKLEGMPSTTGTYNLVVLGTDAYGCTGTRTYPVTFLAPNTDFGDYPSFTAASQLSSTDVWMGTNATDTESASPTTGLATADNLTDKNDEDMTVPSFVVGYSSTLNIPVNVNPGALASGTAKVNVFIDWNGDNDVLDSGETQTAQTMTASGIASFTITPPASAVTATRYMRIRITEGTTSPAFAGSVLLKGEVEDYAISVVAPTNDFGDYSIFPNASSAAATRLRLGATVDVEAAAFTDATATGDDNAGLDDEDGITVPTSAPAGYTSSIGVTVQNTNGGIAYLNAWIDFNRNGVLTDAGEQIVTNNTVTNGTNGSTRNLSYTIPLNASVGLAGVRVRITSVSSPGPDGLDGVGEVEDTLLNITAPPMTDYGDYGGFPLASNAPSNFLRLGSVATDAEGIPPGTLTATSDDTTGEDDEDLNIPILTVGYSTPLIVPVTIVPASVSAGTSRVIAFLDWNGDGDVADTGETLAVQSVSVSGTIAFTLTPPAGTVAGTKYLRVRATEGTTTPTVGGLSLLQGEVEDYPVAVTPTPTADLGDLVTLPSASSTVVATLKLGALVDADPAANANTSATADDILTTDDEDSATIPGLVSGSATTIFVNTTNTSGAPAYLNLWIDYNGNGSLTDPGEQIVTNRVIATGTNATDQRIDFTTPLLDSGGGVGVRVRLTSVASPGPDGQDGNGEVEDYIARLEQCNADIVFMLDNSGSIDSQEWADTTTSVRGIMDRVLKAGSGNRGAVVHYAGSTGDAVPAPQIFIESDFTTDMTTAKSFIRRNGAGEPLGYGDNAIPAVEAIGNALDGVASGAILSTQKILTHASGRPLVVYLFTDAYRDVPNSWLVNPSFPTIGSADAFDQFTSFKRTRGTKFVVTIIPPFSPYDTPAIQACAAIASKGGQYFGAVEPNPADPDGSSSVPRRFKWSNSFLLTQAEMDSVAMDICTAAAPTSDFGDYSGFSSASNQASTAIRIGTAGTDIELPTNIDSTATADNLTGDNDEELTMPVATIGASSTLVVPVNVTPGLLSGNTARIAAFVDWNGDNDVVDAGETLAAQTVSNNGNITFTLTPGVGAIAGQRFLRLRITEGAVAPLFSGASDAKGEVEDYPITLSNATDSGDYVYFPSASSILTSGLFIGAAVDWELTPVTNDTATGDDITGIDDEDGLTIPAVVSQSGTGAIAVRVTNTSGAIAYLNAWIDYNNNGILTDPGEQIATNSTVTNGTNNASRTITFTVPGTAVAGPLGVRVRLTSVSAPGPDGADGNGEVEDGIITVATLLDFGDFDGYAVAGQTGSPLVYLGTSPTDPEPSTMLSNDASGDDSSSTDDEDLVMPIFSPGITTSVVVPVNITPLSISGRTASVRLFVDWNNDNDVADSNETYPAQAVTAAGNVTFSVTPPITCTIGTKYLRLRIAESSAVPTFNGISALKGEVEDYPVTVVPPLAIGNLVFEDKNANRVADAGEGIDGITVQLYLQGDTPGVSTPLATRVTSGGGWYKFTELNEASYIVHIPASQFNTGGALRGMFSIPGTNSADDNAGEDGVDSTTPETSGISTAVVTLVRGAQPTTATGETGFNANEDAAQDTDVNLTIDFGFFRRTGLGNLVFIDADNNGIASASEGVNGVQVELYDLMDTPGVDSPISITTTANGGKYLFQDLYEGGYRIHIPASMFASTGPLYGKVSIAEGIFGDDDVGEDGLNNTVPAIDGVSSNIVFVNPGNAPTATNGETGIANDIDDTSDAAIDLTVDFGFEIPLGLGNLVYVDGNGNGVADEGEGAYGVSVELYTSTQTAGSSLPIASAVTDFDGHYRFDNIGSGSYFVHIPATNFSTGGPLEGKVSVSGTERLSTSDDRVGENGIDSPNPEYSGISSAVITLGTGRQPVDSSNTSTTGENGFLANEDDPNDSQYDLTVDFGFAPPAQNVVGLGNAVFNDLNGNKTFDSGEGISGVYVELFPSTTTDLANSIPLASTRTSSEGYYYFGGLQPGSYIVYLPAKNWANAVTLFGFTIVPKGALNGKLPVPGQGGDTGFDDYLDENGNDPVNASTSGVSSTVITLALGEEPTDETTELGSGNFQDSAIDDNTDLTIDFGFYTPVGVGNMVYADANGDGFASATEGVGGVQVQLFTVGSNPVFDLPVSTVTTSTQTTTLGRYLFSNLLPGTYFIHIPASQFGTSGPLNGKVSISGAQLAGDDNTGEDGLDAGMPVQNGVSTSIFTLSPGTAPTGNAENGLYSSQDSGESDDDIDLTLDLGFTAGLTVGNLVFNDVNNDGNYDDGTDMRLDGIFVELYRDIAGGTPQLVGSVPTSGGGLYRFLAAPGTYFVKIPSNMFLDGGPLYQATSAINGTQNTTVAADDNVSEDGLNDTIPSTSGVRTASFTLATGALPTATTGETGFQSTSDDAADANGNLTIDFGFVFPAAAPMVAAAPPIADQAPSGTESTFAQSGLASPTSDDDGDGFSNLLEHALGDAVSSSLTLVKNSNGSPDAIVRLPAEVASDIEIQLQTSTTGAADSWTSVSASPQTTYPQDGTRQLRYTAISASPQGYARLLISLDADLNGTAEATATSPLHGYATLAPSLGQSTLSQPLLRPATFTGPLENASAVTFTAGRRYYIHVISGTEAGRTIELAGTGATATLATIGNQLAPGTKIVIRPHWTLGELIPTDSVVAGSAAESSDRVLFFENNAFVPHWASSGIQGWTKEGDTTFTDTSARIIPPGEGFLFQARSAGRRLFFTGEVPTAAINIEAKAGNQLFAPVTTKPQTAQAMGITTPVTGVKVWLGDSTPGATGYSSYTPDSTPPLSPFRAFILSSTGDTILHLQP